MVDCHRGGHCVFLIKMPFILMSAIRAMKPRIRGYLKYTSEKFYTLLTIKPLRNLYVGALILSESLILYLFSIHRFSLIPLLLTYLYC